MKKVTKILLIITTTFLLLLIGSISYNCSKSSKEKDILTPLGNMVRVNEGNMSIYTCGKGEKTLVFLSGGGTCSPILDFKSLYSLLCPSYKIVVVEKFGYGFSDILPRSRDINVILNDTRTALQKCGINGPFVLLPHSQGGLEALYWAQHYPREVEAIIALDMATPYHYENYKINLPLLYILREFHLLGFTRFIPSIWKGDAVKYGTLTDSEKELYKALFYSRTATRNMIDEVKIVKDNAKKVSESSFPTIPFLMIVSNGEGTGMKKDEWINISEKFANDVNAEVIEYDAPHYIHDHKYNEISDDINNFIEIL